MPYVYDPDKKAMVWQGPVSAGTGGVQTGRLPAQGRLQTPKKEEKKGGGGLGGLVGRLTSPLIDLPDQSNPVLRFLEQGIESTSSPVGLATAALLPVTGGTSLGAAGAIGLAARIGTRAAAEIAVSAAAGEAADQTAKRLENAPGPIRLLAPIAAGVVAGGATSRALGGRYAKPRLKELELADAAKSVEDFTDPVDKLSFLIRQAPKVNADVETLRSADRSSRAARYGQTLQKEGFTVEGYKKAAKHLEGSYADTRFAAPGTYFTPQEMDDIVGRIGGSSLRLFDQQNAFNSVMHVLDKGKMPTNYEADLLAKVYGEDFVTSLMKHRSRPEKIRQLIFDTIGLPRTVMASVDLSAPLRQGAMLIGHPKQFFGSMVPMIRALGDESYAKRIDDIIQNDDMYKLARESGVEFTGMGQRALQNTEEQFMGKLGGPLSSSLLGEGIKSSERAYATYLNKLRGDTFNSITKNWEGTTKTAADYKAVANFVSYATGRGKLPKVLDAPIMNAAWFSPKFVYSRFAAPAQLLTAPPAVKAVIAKDLAAFVGTGLAVAFLGNKSGLWDVELDPRSSDFGKGRVGNTRYDFWAGYQPIARYVTQAVTGQTKTSSGRIVEANRAETVGRFFQSKLAPVPGLTVDMLRGESFTGEQIRGDANSITDQAAGRLMPLFIQDVASAIKEGGIAGGLRTIPAGLGVGVQTYSTVRETQNMAGQEIFNKDYRDLTAAQQDVVNSDPRVINKQSEFDLRGESEYSTEIELATETRLASERTAVAALMTGQLSPKDFADHMGTIQLISKVKKDEASRAFGIDHLPPNSPLQKALDGYYSLYEQADMGYEQGVQTYILDWEKFDQMEQQYLASLDEEQRAFVDGRRRAEHDPTADFFFKGKELISNSGYYDTIDKAFDRNKALVRVVLPGATSYNDLLEASNLARVSGDTATYKKIQKAINRISSDAGDAKEKMRKRDAGLDKALFETGRTSVLLNKSLTR
jgi:hypothetical protein